MTTPFGTPMYNAGVAFEEVFKKAGSWVDFKLQPTPGAMYIVKYTHENALKIATGQLPQVIASTSTATMGFTVEGRPPFDKCPIPDNRAIFSSPSFVIMFCTFDPNIKSLKDLAGKRAGLAEKSRPFQGILPNKPYFEKGLEIWDKIDWQYLGAANSKEALLNNTIDAHQSVFWGKVEKAADGTFICKEMEPDTPTMELMSSGRKLHFLEFEPELIKKSFDFRKDMMLYPILVKKGACQGIEQDMWARVSIGVYAAGASMPDDVLQEIIRVRHQHRKELAAYDATLKFFPETPYPLGTPESWVHDGVQKAMKNLGIPLP